MVSTIRYDNTTGFLNICCGGVGLEAGEVFSARYLADGRAFPQVLVHIDTDPIEAAFVEHRIHIGLDGGMLDALRADPEKFGPAAVTILKEHAQYLDAEDIVNGSRTIRCLTQLSFAYHERKIATSLRKALHDLISRSYCRCKPPAVRTLRSGLSLLSKISTAMRGRSCLAVACLLGRTRRDIAQVALSGRPRGELGLRW